MTQGTDRCAGSVSWKLFNELYENQYDLFRKLRFFIQAGKSGRNEKLALDMVEDFLARKEGELERLRQSGLEEWAASGGAAGLPPGPGTPLLEHVRAGNEKSLVLHQSVPVARASFWSRFKARIRGAADGNGEAAG